MRGAATQDMLEVGFTAPRAHHIVAIDRCPILAPGLDGAIPAAWAIAEILKPANKPLDIQVTATDSGMDMDVRGSGPLNAGAHHGARPRRREAQARAHYPPRRTGGASRAAAVEGRPLPRAAAAGRLPASDRRRRSDAGAAGLEHVGAAKRVADLFCGIGTFALRLAERARVTAADSEAARSRR